MNQVWADRHRKLGREFNDIEGQYLTVVGLVDDTAARAARYSKSKIDELDLAVRGLIDQKAAISIYKTCFEEASDRADFEGMVAPKLQEYSKLSEWEKYGGNNEYIEFKRSVWVAQHPEKPLPPMETYFQGAVDRDLDIHIESMTRNLKCPLTLQMFKEPMRADCGHIFEKVAIYEMLQEASILCPQPGCEHLITKEELKLDKVTLRLVEAEGSESECEFVSV